MTDTETEHPFGPGVTPPHRPQSLTVPADGEATRPIYGEESHPSFGEGTLEAYGEGVVPLPTEGEASHRSPRSTPAGRTSAFIVGEDREE